MNKQKTLTDMAGRPIQFDLDAAREKAVDFLTRRFPGGFTEKGIQRAMKALEREARDVEIGALDREFMNG